MKALFLGGTCTSSSAYVQLALSQGWDITLMNRGNHAGDVPADVELLKVDCNDSEAVRRAVWGKSYDVIADFIAFTPLQASRDIELFREKCGQYIFISSASAYQKPMNHYQIREDTPLKNPYWQYSRDKIECEELLTAAYRKLDFPVTIVRPSHTYGLKSIPVPIHGAKGSWQVVRRMLAGKPIIVHGDGLSLWTFTYNTDFAKGFCGLMGNPKAIGEAVHITSDESLTWNDACRSIGRAFGVEPHFVHISSDFLAAFNADLLGALLGDKAHSVVFDNSKIKRLVPGFCANICFDEGVRRCAAYIQAHPEYQAEDPGFDAWCDSVIAAYFSGLTARPSTGPASGA